MLVRRSFFVLALLLGFASAIATVASPARPTALVVPVTGQIDTGTAHLVARSVAEAERDHDAAIVLDVDTFGGLVDAGVAIRDTILASHVPVYAYVSHRAISAGALVTLSSPHVLMAPAATLGDAEPIPRNPKTVSYLRKEFAATAMRTNRDPRLAEAMVDTAVPARPYADAGRLLTFTADEAVQARFVEGTAVNLPAAIERWKLPAATQRESYTFAERLARFATNVEVSGLLLAIGFVGLLVEMQTLHGIAGLVGIGSLSLFFGTHVYAGFSNGLVIALAVAGLVGILFELHVLPGHGVAGTLGIAALIGAVFLSFGIPFFFAALQAFAIAIVLSAIGFAIATRIFPESAFMRRLVFLGVQGPDFVTSADQRSLLGAIGIASSYLRPAGVAVLHGKRIDVLTEGEFVSAGSAVEVTRVEGARIFVRPIVPGV